MSQTVNLNFSIAEKVMIEELKTKGTVVEIVLSSYGTEYKVRYFWTINRMRLFSMSMNCLE